MWLWSSILNNFTMTLMVLRERLHEGLVLPRYWNNSKVVWILWTSSIDLYHKYQNFGESMTLKKWAFTQWIMILLYHHTASHEGPGNELTPQRGCLQLGWLLKDPGGAWQWNITTADALWWQAGSLLRLPWRRLSAEQNTVMDTGWHRPMLWASWKKKSSLLFFNAGQMFYNKMSCLFSAIALLN